MKRNLWIFLGIIPLFCTQLVSVVLADEPKSAATEFAPEAIDFFETKVRPVLAENCTKCHGPDEQKSGLRLDSRTSALEGGALGPAVVPGDPENSILIEAVRQDDVFLKMPPKGKLTEEAVQALTDWIKMGAPWPQDQPVAASEQESAAAEHWAFQSISAPEPPAVKDASWVQTPVDAFILAKLEAKGLTPAPEADRRTLLRRVYYDLIGLPPTAEEVAAFEADDSADAFAKVVDRLLASPRYGERWGRHWLDVARYADTKGYVFQEDRRYPYAYTYRDYVIRSFNEDKPYNQFVLEQLAADQLPHDESDNRMLAAMGFLTVGRRFLNNSHDIIDDRIDVVGRGLLGLTVACARCHDHKYDPIPSEDYYSFYGVFDSSVEPESLPELKPVEPGPQYDDYLKQLAERKQKITDYLDGKRNEIQKDLRENASAYLLGALALEFNPRHGDLDKVAREQKVEPRRLRSFVARLAPYLDRAKQNHDPIFTPWQALAALAADSFATQAPEVLKTLGEGPDAKPIDPLVRKALTEGDPLTSMSDVARRYGELFAKTSAEETDDADRKAIRDVLVAAEGPFTFPAEETERMLNRAERNEFRELNQKIDQLNASHPGSPPRAMVMVDSDRPHDIQVFMRGNPGRRGKPAPRRFLQVLAGKDREPFPKDKSGRLEMARAIVREDNPLTARVMVNRIWMYHFGFGLVRTPSDFGLRSDPPSHPELLDYLATYFIRNNWSVKSVHRAILLSNAYQQASFDRPECREVDPENLLLWRQNRQRLDFESMRDALLTAAGQLDLTMGGRSVSITDAPFTTRRTVYSFIDRQNLEGLFRSFDFATPNATSPGRFTTIVPQQALFLMNDAFTAEQVQHLADRVETSVDAEAKVRTLYRIVFGRDPEPNELAMGRAFLDGVAGDVAPNAPAWQYGYGGVDEGGHVANFQPFPHWTGKAWQFGPDLPHPEGSYLHLDENGGHVGNDQNHAAIWRWVAPRDGVIRLDGTLAHKNDKGDGVRGRIVAGRGGVLGTWTAHNKRTSTTVDRYEVRQGETIDFVADCQSAPSFDSFLWDPAVRWIEPEASPGEPTVWNAHDDFQGPPPAPLTPLEAYAQVLLMTNEFMYVD